MSHPSQLNIQPVSHDIRVKTNEMYSFAASWSNKFVKGKSDEEWNDWNIDFSSFHDLWIVLRSLSNDCCGSDEFDPAFLSVPIVPVRKANQAITNVKEAAINRFKDPRGKGITKTFMNKYIGRVKNYTNMFMLWSITLGKFDKFNVLDSTKLFVSANSIDYEFSKGLIVKLIAKFVDRDCPRDLYSINFVRSVMVRDKDTNTVIHGFEITLSWTSKIGRPNAKNSRYTNFDDKERYISRRTIERFINRLKSESDPSNVIYRVKLSRKDNTKISK